MTKLDVINEELVRLHEDSDNIIDHMVNKELLNSVEEILAVQLTRIADQITHLYSMLDGISSDVENSGGIPESMYESVEDDRG